MSNENDNEPLPQSKFEWRPDDVIVLSQEEADAVKAEYLEWLLSPDKNAVPEGPQPNSDDRDK